MRKLLILFLALAAGVAHAGAREQMDVFSNGVQGLAASFEQRVYDAGGALKETSSGTVQLQAPRQFRWEYLKPYPQLIVADGDHIWIYDPDMEQVNVRQQSLEEQNSPLALLIDVGQMERQFKVTEGGQGQGLSWLELVPPGLRSGRPGAHGDVRRPGPAHGHGFLGLEAQPGLRARHLHLRQARGRRPDRRGRRVRRSHPPARLKDGVRFRT